ncbi:MAG: FAD-dependent oxidoreductase [Acidobacteria bacterium]|nr:FAD-dependent oxidoreductase [Acidobacteriota bacterium]
MSAATHTVIIGGGVIGVSCAYFLARRGARVTLLEQSEIAAGASFGNAGVIAPGHAPINKPGRVRQALKSLFDPLSPLFVAPRPDPALAAWLWAFRKACTAEHVESAMRLLGPLGHATRSLFDDLVKQEKLQCDFRPTGYHEAYLTAPGLAAGTKEAALVQRHGYHPETLSGDALREREPALNRQVIGGIFYPEAATVNPHRFVLELAESARRQGASLRTGTGVAEILAANRRVTGVRTASSEVIEADAVVLAAGVWSAKLARGLGLKLPLQGAKGYHRDAMPAEGTMPFFHHACVFAEKSVFATPMDGFVRFAGTLEFSGLNHQIRRPRLDQLTNAARLYANGIGETTPLSEWCGLRPCLPDGLPAVGPVATCGGLFIATGHAMLGLTLAPVTGKLMAECVLDGTPAMDLRPLRPERF